MNLYQSVMMLFSIVFIGIALYSLIQLFRMDREHKKTLAVFREIDNALRLADPCSPGMLRIKLIGIRERAGKKISDRTGIDSIINQLKGYIYP